MRPGLIASAGWRSRWLIGIVPERRGPFTRRAFLRRFFLFFRCCSKYTNFHQNRVQMGAFSTCLNRFIELKNGLETAQNALLRPLQGDSWRAVPLPAAPNGCSKSGCSEMGGAAYPRSQKRDRGHPRKRLAGTEEAGPLRLRSGQAFDSAQGRLSTPLKYASLRMTNRFYC